MTKEEYRAMGTADLLELLATDEESKKIVLVVAERYIAIGAELVKLREK